MSQKEVFLLRVRVPGADELISIAPGGGLHTGEAIEEGLKRELHRDLLRLSARIKVNLAASGVSNFSNVTGLQRRVLPLWYPRPGHGHRAF